MCVVDRKRTTDFSQYNDYSVTAFWFNLKTRLSSRESAAGSVHRQDSTCPNLPIPQSENVGVEIFFVGGGVTRTMSEIP